MPTASPRPNVLMIYCDDLCYGDIAAHDNPIVRTPNLDRLHDQSVRLMRYTSGPVCTPARAALMTGRHPYRTRAIDTYCGRSMLAPDETTLAETFTAAGYRTCISGKWHLGDCYPTRASDRGFEEALVHRGGGLRQPANVGHAGYFDPELMHNGEMTATTGYCSDIFTDHAITFIEAHADESWFAYLAFNAPHSPFEIHEDLAEQYRKQGVNETFARIYAMVENIDANVGRVMDRLEALGLADNTIVMFSSDHGPCGSSFHEGQCRYNAGLRERKGTMYEGGLRVPCFLRWPSRFLADHDVDRLANPIDIMPTLLDAVNVSRPGDTAFDGVSLLPLLTDAGAAACWPDRQVCMQWHRGDVPVRYRNFAVVGQRYKLLRSNEQAADELYDLVDDPGEMCNLADAEPGRVAAMRAVYERWFDDVSATRPANYAPPRIVVGSARESPTMLTRQDWRVIGPDGWSDEHRGTWLVRAERPGRYRLTMTHADAPANGTARLIFAGRYAEAAVATGGDCTAFTIGDVPAGEASLEGWIEVDGQRSAPRHVAVERLA